MIRGHRTWITARYENGELQLDLHGACQYLPPDAQNPEREVSVVLPVSHEDAEKVKGVFDDIVTQAAAKIQLKTTLAAADALSFAAKVGEVAG